MNIFLILFAVFMLIYLAFPPTNYEQYKAILPYDEHEKIRRMNLWKNICRLCSLVCGVIWILWNLFCSN